jgi:pilus assembly protein Flp/PilA
MEESTNMKKLLWKVQIWKDTKGQDLIEYALMAGFVAVAAGAIVPGVATSMKTIFTKINGILANSAAS